MGNRPTKVTPETDDLEFVHRKEESIGTTGSDMSEEKGEEDEEEEEDDKNLDPFSKFECHGPFTKEDEFQIIEKLHKGRTSSVYCVYTTYDNSNKVYAMKKISKELCKQHNLTKYAALESHILKLLNPYPYVCQFISSFKSEEYLYIIMKCYKMDLCEVIQKYDLRIPENEAKRVGAQVFLALRYLHSKNIVYRDLKPENILVENDVNFDVALTDFGFVKMVKNRERCDSIVGNLENFSPELIEVGEGKKSNYGVSTDWWSFGNFLYEIVCGKHPFYKYKNGKGKNEFEDYEREILESIREFKPEDLKFPKMVSKNFKDLVRKLLVKDPLKRLGTKNENDIRNHKWFEEVPWFEFSSEDELVRFQGFTLRCNLL